MTEKRLTISKIIISALAISAVGFMAYPAPKKPVKKAATAGPSAAELLEQAENAYLNYNLEEASNLVSQAKNRKGAEDVRGRLNLLGKRIVAAENFMDRVEDIVILDSITVPKDHFFKAYKLPASAGSLSNGDDLDIDADYIFTNEGGDYRIWAAPDSIGILNLVESVRLTDGSWQDPQIIEDLAVGDYPAAYPFMMADGVTLYYAQEGPESLGGYDIMVATRDASDGSFLQPQNLGMPYNSPYDDYLLAIDELNGVGWFATDRNQLGDDLTVYLFKVNDLRKNYDPEETDDLEDRAMLRDWQSTGRDDEDYSELLETIRAIDPEVKAKVAEFHLPMDGGVVYTSFDDFKNASAAHMMHAYLIAHREYEDMESRLSAMRRQYHDNPSEGLKKQIVFQEGERDRKREEMKHKLSDVYRAERRQ